MGSEQIKILAKNLINKGSLTKERYEKAMGNISEKLIGLFNPNDSICKGDMDESAFISFMREKTKTQDGSLDEDLSLLYSIINADGDDVLTSDEFISIFNIGKEDGKISSAELSTSISQARKIDVSEKTENKETSGNNVSGEITIEDDNPRLQYYAEDFDEALKNGDAKALLEIIDSDDITDGDLAKILKVLGDSGETIIPLYNEKFAANERADNYPMANKMWQRIKNAALAGNEDAVLVLARETEYVINTGESSNPFINNIFGIEDDSDYPSDISLIKKIYYKHEELYGKNRLIDFFKEGKYTWYDNNDYYISKLKEARRSN